MAAALGRPRPSSCSKMRSTLTCERLDSRRPWTRDDGQPFATDDHRPFATEAREVKLCDIKTFVVGNPPPHYGGRYFVFVKLITDSRVEGVGEAYCVPFDPHLVERMLVDVFDRYLRNEDPHQIESLWR